MFLFYYVVHVLALIALMGIVIVTMFSKPTRAQNGILSFTIFAIVYVYGFLMEISVINANIIYEAKKVQYMGLSLMAVGATVFVKELCKKKVPLSFYLFEVFVSMVTQYFLFTTEKNRLFYKGMKLITGGAFERIQMEYGIVFYLFRAYLLLGSVVATICIINQIRKSGDIVRKRGICCLLGLLCGWLPVVLKHMNLTGGYEVPAIGILGACACVYLALTRYGTFDSVHLAKENALKNGREGVLVTDSDYNILYFNQQMEHLFGHLAQYKHASAFQSLSEILSRERTTIQHSGKLYDMCVEPLMESGYTQGYMVWAHDMTEYYEKLNEVNNKARKDPLTGVNNRSYYETIVDEYLRSGQPGTMFMVDLDNFKRVNDTYGHQGGDAVLILFSEVIQSVLTENSYACRIGGDEFSLFFKGETDKQELSKKAEYMLETFRQKLNESDYAGITSISIGIAMTNEENVSSMTFEKIYSHSDRALYLSKQLGKNTYSFYV